MLKKYKPLTPSLRHRIIVQKPKSLIKLDKHLKKIKNKHAGRNNTGRITIRHRGSKSDHKRYLRIIDRARILGKYTKCKVIDIQYDPNISGFLALLEPLKLDTSYRLTPNSENSVNLRFLILAPYNMQIGDIIEGEEYIKLDNYINNSPLIANSGADSVLLKNLSLTNGINRPLKDLPIGSYIYNLKDISAPDKRQFLPDNHNTGKYARSAGTYCILLKTYNKNMDQIEQPDFYIDNPKSEEISVIRLPSKKIISIPSTNVASLGQVSNTDHNLTIKGKAGANR
jgi:large subunit ribosomal protein L2